LRRLARRDELGENQRFKIVHVDFGYAERDVKVRDGCRDPITSLKAAAHGIAGGAV
jgi:hypothetical protein